MNERIKELIDQATVWGEEYLPGNDGHPTLTVFFDKERYAKLIMAECAVACDDEQCNTLCSPKALINMHFGIEE